MLSRIRKSNKYKASGEIAVFLALIMSVMSMFTVYSLNSIRMIITRQKVSQAMDAAIDSCFAEYNYRLFKRFHLMYIDETYMQSGVVDDELLREHFILYINENIRDEDADVKVTDLYVSEVYILCKETVGDNRDTVSNDIVKYIKDKRMAEGRSIRVSKKNMILEFVKEVFGHSEDVRNDSSRNGEIEFILHGYENDYMNVNMAHSLYEEKINENHDEDYDLPVRAQRVHDEYENMTYEEYLYDELNDMNEETIVERIMSLINEDVRNNGSPEFNIRKCIKGIEVCADISGAFGNDVSAKRQYAYSY